MNEEEEGMGKWKDLALNFLFHRKLILERFRTRSTSVECFPIIRGDREEMMERIIDWWSIPSHFAFFVSPSLDSTELEFRRGAAS